MNSSTHGGTEHWDRWIERILLLSIVAVFVVRAISLFTTPIIDSYRWWGDESWLMTEFMTQMREGVFRHPYAFGASIQHSSGSLLGSMWLTALVYGGATSLFQSIQPEIVHIGRIVSFACSGVVLLMTFRLLRNVGVSSTLSLVSVALLCSSTAFFYMGHSARYDMLTALAILGLIIILSSIVKQAGTWRSTFLIGALLVGGATISVHVLLLSALPVVAFLIRSGAMRRPKNVIGFIAGCLAAGSLLVGAQAIVGNVSVFGSSQTTTFVNNVREIPAMRPFSRSVQVANVVQKIKTMMELAPVLFISTIALSIVLAIGTYMKQRGRTMQPAFTWLTLLSLLVILSWVIFESAAPTSYVIYVLPFACIICGIGLESLLTWGRRSIPGLRAVLGCLGIMLLIQSTFRDHAEAQIGEKLSTANEQVISEALAAINVDRSIRHDTISRIVAFNPAIHRLLATPGVNPMTTHFVEFPASAASLPGRPPCWSTTAGEQAGCRRTRFR